MIKFKGRHFKKVIIMMAIRWYVAYALSYRNIEELMAERGVSVDHSTINRWVVKYAPQLENNFRKKHKRKTGSSMRMDETYIKVKGQWFYLYRAVDKDGETIDFQLSEKRNEAAAKAFFTKAINASGKPKKVTIDKSGANNAALKSLNNNLKEKDKIEIRQIKYLNNVVEQDHRFIKKIIKPMMGFKSFESAQATLAGIELHHMLRKNQYKNSEATSVFKQFYSLAA
jgi:putative transposase